MNEAGAYLTVAGRPGRFLLKDDDRGMTRVWHRDGVFLWRGGLERGAGGPTQGRPLSLVIGAGLVFYFVRTIRWVCVKSPAVMR